ncbi:DUF6424 family protein [Streptomyces sp. NPDC006290]|uniref:DUF6424 family protein n=1 Tax=Streptomyces sp. NPDC006290 TaxID=3156745 RepID=UPI0033B81EFE
MTHTASPSATKSRTATGAKSRTSAAAKPRTPAALAPGGTESENHPWKIQLVDHPPRFESTYFQAAKKLTHKVLAEMSEDDLPYGPQPPGAEHWEMHHGGSLWVKGAHGWRMYRARVGIEWSMQFCADPAKVDRLRQEAAELIDAFPDTLPALGELGYKGAQELLRTPITDADGVERWTDSLFNACVPMSNGNHQGILPKVPGEHHYPWPVKGADFVRYDDFQLWVNLPDGTHGAVSPVDRRGSGDGHVRLVHAPEGSTAGDTLAKAQSLGKMAVFPANSAVALEAFKQQIEPGRRTATGPLVTATAPRRGGATRRTTTRRTG